MGNPSPIQQELLDHMADAIAEYQADGLTPEQAKAKATAEFGDLANIATELNALNATHRLVQFGWVGFWILYGVISLLIAAITYALSDLVIGTIAERIMLWWFYAGALGWAWLLSYSYLQYAGVKSARSIWKSIIVSLAIHFCIIIVLDIDDFETTLNTMIASAAFGVVLQLLWSRLSFSARSYTLILHAIVVAILAIANYRIFASWLNLPCMYITPDTTVIDANLLQCSQVGLADAVTYPIIGVMLLASYVAARWLVGVWRTGNTWFIFTTTTLLAVPVLLPTMVYDLNNYGSVEVVQWKEPIYQAYEDILGRKPEQKDIDFYAETKTYKNMQGIRDTLHASTERRIKINLLYTQILKREATPEEIDAYVHKRTTVSDIRAELTKQE